MSISKHKARSLDRSSSSSSESRNQPQTRSKSEPQKNSSNNNPLSSTTEHRNRLTASTGICDIPDFYSIILGPTADETLLVGLNSLLKTGFGCNSEDYKTAASEQSSLGNIQKDTGEFSESEKNYNTEDDENVGEYSIRTSKQLQSVDYGVKIKKSEVIGQTEPPASTSPSRLPEERHSATFDAIDEEKDNLIEQPIEDAEGLAVEATVQSIRESAPEEVERTNSIDIGELPKPPSSISKKEGDEKSKTQIKPPGKRESYSIGIVVSRSPSRAPSEREPMDENLTRGSLEKRVSISNLKPAPKEDNFNLEDKQPNIEENGTQTSALPSQYKIIVESGNNTSEIVVEEKVPENTHSEKKLDKNIVGGTEGITEISSKRAPVESSRRSSRTDSQPRLSKEMIKKSPVGLQNASKMSHELTSIILEDSEENDGTSGGSDESESAAVKPTVEESESKKYQSDRSLRSSDSINSKLSGNKNGINWKSNESKDVADRLSKKSERDSRGSIKPFDRTTRGSKSSRNSYETSFDSVKVEISEETIEEVTEGSDEGEKLESLADPEQSCCKSVPTLESTKIEKPIKSKSSITVKVSERIVEENIPEKTEQIKRKSKQSLTRSSKKSKSSVSDTKVKSIHETTVEITEETVGSDNSTGSKKFDQRRPKRNDLCKKYESTCPDSYSKSSGSSSPVLQLRKCTHGKNSLASCLKSTTSSSKTDSCTYTCNIKGGIDVCQSGDSNSKCAFSICSDKKMDRYSQIPCPFLRPCIKTTVHKLNGVCSCCRSAVTDEISGDEHKNQTLCFDCYTSTSSTTATDSETSKSLRNGAIAKGQVRYAITKITEYGKFTTFEVMKSTRKIPKFMPARLEGVFVLKHKM